MSFKLKIRALRQNATRRIIKAIFALAFGTVMVALALKNIQQHMKQSPSDQTLNIFILFCGTLISLLSIMMIIWTSVSAYCEIAMTKSKHRQS